MTTTPDEKIMPWPECYSAGGVIDERLKNPDGTWYTHEEHCLDGYFIPSSQAEALWKGARMMLKHWQENTLTDDIAINEAIHFLSEGIGE